MEATTQPALSPVTVHSKGTEPLDLTSRVQLDRWVLTGGRVVEGWDALDGQPVAVNLTSPATAPLMRSQAVQAARGRSRGAAGLRATIASAAAVACRGSSAASRSRPAQGCAIVGPRGSYGEVHAVRPGDARG